MRWLRRVLIVLLALAAAMGIAGFYVVRSSFPQVDGRVEVEGLRDEVEVIRDQWGIPHIYASNTYDLFFAQGYTHAQDRFWQMDFWRHIGSGRLSELFGSSQVDTDVFLRSLGWARLAETELAELDPELRDILQSYADGVNAYLDGRSGPDISLEYALLPLQNSSYQVEPWTPINTLTWAKVMAWDLRNNMESETARAILSTSLPVERIEQLYPPYPEDHPVIVPSDHWPVAEQEPVSPPEAALPALASALDSAREVSALTGGGFEGIGSNNWVVARSLTESGKPLLANDPHLSIQMPSIWYANGLHCVGDSPDCPYQLVGFSFAGSPGVVIGHNEHIAWGVTNQAVDTLDLFIERVNPDNPDQYEVSGEWVDFEVRTEVIEVAGGDDVEINVRSTRHGPVISGTFLEPDEFDDSSALDLPEPYVVTLAWQSLQPSTLVKAILGINRASGYDEFRGAASYWDIAAQNLVYADVEGNIAYQATGEIPIRAKGDGRYPVPGWSSEYEWVGLVPFEDVPYLLNPGSGYIETANQLVLAPGSEPFLAIDSSYGYRADRIDSLIPQSNTHTVESMQQIQFDSFDGNAANLVPYLVAVPSGGDTRIEEIQSRLRTWSEGERAYQATGDSTGAAAYAATWRHLLMNTFADELPEDYWPEGGSRWFEVVKHLLEEPGDPWWDNVATPIKEDRDAVLAESMVAAHEELTALLGNNPERWAWGKLHTAYFENQTFGKSGIGPIEWLFNRTAPPRVGGGPSLVNAVGWNAAESYVVDWVPSMRMVIDLADLSRSTFIHTTGQSGHAFHRHYDDMLELWADGEQVQMLWTRDQVETNAAATLTLTLGD